MAAEVDVNKVTAEPTCFDRPTNPKIKFWDLPGIGTPNYRDMETYREKVKLEQYHAFLIFSSHRFNENDKQLAQEIKTMNKRFFFIRAKIDENVRAEKQKKKKPFNEDAVLDKIRSSCSANLAGLVRNEEHIFLISNHNPTKWDFARLCQASHSRYTADISAGEPNFVPKHPKKLVY